MGGSQCPSSRWRPRVLTHSYFFLIPSRSREPQSHLMIAGKPENSWEKLPNSELTVSQEQEHMEDSDGAQQSVQLLPGLQGGSTAGGGYQQEEGDSCQ